MQNLKSPGLAPSVANFDRLPDGAHIDVRAVAAITGRCVASVWNDVKRGALPAPHKIGIRSTRWRVGELRRALGLTGGV